MGSNDPAWTALATFDFNGGAVGHCANGGEYFVTHHDENRVSSR